MTTRKNHIEKEKIKKVTATISEMYVEPEYVYHATCPYCNTNKRDVVFEENRTIKVMCFMCDKEYKIKIPKFY